MDSTAASADQVIAVLRSSHDSLAGFVTSLDADGVTHASGASEWTVAQVLSHLGSGAEIGLAALQAGLTGVDGRGPGFNESVWDRWNAKSPQDQATDFVTSNDTLVSAYEATDAATRESARIDLGFLPEPVDLATLGRIRLSEFAMHSWDVAVGFDPSATLPAGAPELLLDTLGIFFGFYGRPDELKGARGTLAVQLHEPERSLGLEIGDAITLTEPPTSPDGTLTAPAEAWLRLVAGRLAPQYTPASVTLTGDLVSLDDLRRAFPGY
jgi:uncharacterized protein (TIGR03083 family)